MMLVKVIILTTPISSVDSDTTTVYARRLSCVDHRLKSCISFRIIDYSGPNNYIPMTDILFVSSDRDILDLAGNNSCLAIATYD